MSEQEASERGHRHRRRRRTQAGPSTRMKIGAAVFIFAVFVVVGTIAFVELGPIYFPARMKPQASAKFIMVGPAAVTIVNASTNGWTGGTVTINDHYTQKFGPMATNQMSVIPFRESKAGRIWFNIRNERLLKVTVTPDGAPPIEWLQPSR